MKPTPEMSKQMKINCKYLMECKGWTKWDCKVLADDYLEVMQTPEGFESIRAHLASVAPWAEVQFQRI